MFTHEYKLRSSRVLGEAWGGRGAMSDGPSNREVDKPGVNRPALAAQDQIRAG